MHIRWWVIGIIGVIYATFGIAAQDSCPDIVQNALEQSHQQCDILQRNEACYGHQQVTVEPQNTDSIIVFSSPGDKSNVNDIQTFSLQPYDANSESWGVVLLSLQANLPETVPGQSVKTILFGDVTLQNAVTPLTQIEATINATTHVNARSGPGTTQPIVTSLSPDSSILANGQSEDGLWVRFTLPETGETAWIFHDLVQGEALETLSIVDVEAKVLNPMQAVYFRSGVGDAECSTMPDSGVLIQTPKGVGRINFTINDVSIDLGSTIYIQATPDDVMRIYVLEGEIIVTVDDIQQPVPAGTVVTILLDENLSASGTPSLPEPYDIDDATQFDGLLELLATEEQPAITVAEPYADDVANLLPLSSDPCIVNVNYEISSRGGPGTEYHIVEKLQPDVRREVSQQAVGIYDYTWYQIGNVWVREDVVTTEGDCGAEFVPELAGSDFPTIGHYIIYSIHTCSPSTGPGSYESRPIRVNEELELGFGIITPGIVESANRALVDGKTPHVAIDGVEQPITSINYASDQSTPGAFDGVKYSFVRTELWTVTPGTHTISANWGDYSASCTFTAWEGSTGS